MTTAFINRIATAVPPHDVHRAFVDFADSMLAEGTMRNLFRRMARLSAIEHRYSFIRDLRVAPTSRLAAAPAFQILSTPLAARSQYHARPTHVVVSVADLLWNATNTFNPFHEIVHDLGQIATGFPAKLAQIPDA